LLVTADRYEHRRFPGWTQWAEPSYLKHGLSLLPREHLGYFYEYVRPAIAYLLKYRKSMWFRHGPERPAYGGNQGFNRYNWDESTPYPAEYMPQLGADNRQDWYSVESGRPPFMDCFWHGRTFRPWAFVPRPVAKEHGVKIGTLASRDHLGLRGRIPLKDWIFMLCRGHYSYDKKDGPLPGAELLYNSKGHMELMTASRMLSTVDRFLDMFCCLRVEEEDVV
jgi:hypothetical protein